MYHRILVTGGAGFIGSNYVRFLLKGRKGVFVVNLDALTYAGNRDNVREFESRADYRFVHGDITDRELVSSLLREHDIEAVVNFAAESHVDRSIAGAEAFVRTNVGGTLAMLDAARAHGVKKFLQIGTDEVYGSLGPEGFFTEETPYHPNNPYSASKAGADLLALSYQRTFGLPVVITRTSNNYGPHQFPEKLIPLMITSALTGKPLPVYGDGQNVRDWIYVEDNCRALDLVLAGGRVGEVYNIGGGNEKKNIEIVNLLCESIDARLGLSGEKSTKKLITWVEDRLGHDRRYATDSAKIERELGWRNEISFEEGMRRTVDWYVSNEDWWKRIQTGEYRRP
ncbi:MAG TPA: dTDP-glucose 4,6-dehydratase [Blastocatellia bacterium]|nr:dTDP-glucose 4,6-dehydratase [Blastocatellia bacterium]